MQKIGLAMTEEKKETEFKVVDKRRYSSEGVKREGVDLESHETSSSGSGSSGSSIAGSGRSGTGTSGSGAKSVPKAEDKNTSASRASNPESQLDFASFLMSLAHQTLVLLGQAPNPETNTLSENLEAAKQTIDILGMLEEKTRGNLSKDEEQLFTELLSSLRIAYVQKTNPSK